MSELAACAICGSSDGDTIWSIPKAPLFPLLTARAAGKAKFGRLKIVACARCGHLYNAAFEARHVDSLYASHSLTNEPVSPGMVEAMKGIAANILRHAPLQANVLEVGGGGGALALFLAEHARELHLVEPSRAVSAERFAGTRVTFHNAMFPAASLGARLFDLVVCRQVIEHVPAPIPFLAALRAQVKDGGIAYLELPDADYACDNASPVDFHYPHIHYFRKAEIKALTARAGFSLVETIGLKGGHDMALVLRADTPTEAPPPPRPRAGGLAQALAAAAQRGRSRLDAIPAPIALYGANAYSQAILGLYPDVKAFAAMFDDTDAYAGQRVYGGDQEIPVELPSNERVGHFAAVIITAYLHDGEIARRLRALGYAGQVFTARNDGNAATGTVPPSLFQ